MKYKKILVATVAIIISFLMFNTKLVHATENIDFENNTMLTITEKQYAKKVTEAQYNSIEKILEYISKEIKNIDDKIALTRTIAEYEKYPAVRLNIDTPYFGMGSIVNAKLKIRDGVSTVDIATGYSIRNVVNKKVIKLPTFEVSNIVVITRDVKLNMDMTYADAQVSIFKLLEYLAQTKDVNKFVDKQLTNMIKGYFSKEKIEVIDNIKKELEEIEENLSIALHELSYVSAITEQDISEDLKTWDKYSMNVSGVQTLIKDVCLSYEKLQEIYENITAMNGEVKLFRFNVNKKYLEVFNNINLDQAVYLIVSDMNTNLNYLEKYINNSKIEIKEEILDVVEETTNNEDASLLSAKKEYEEVYKVAAESIVQTMKKDLEKANEILERVIQYRFAVAEQQAKLAENPDLELEKIEELNAKEIVEDLLKIYIGFLNKENVFLTENAKVNITNIKKSQDIDITSFEEIEYIYINLSAILMNISDNFVSSSVISNKRTSNSLKEVINKVIEINKKMKEQE